ncbi:hypothetical protein QLH52_03715 [Methylomonas sp. OY6]|uniref:Secreted protein n=1 Tax=Methylomonas defluvii TaxID=3045149 RepID=A0ABU4UCC8_9GAMM|nr:hypothetical protein [Methylomonas sp. OY6]MDX8126374.1 hypothetical protein [Methylomonas sp. OY6]
MIKTKLAKAVSMTVAGVALSAGASTASAHVMYNTFTTTAASATDGWNYTYDGPDVDTVATGPESGGYQGTQVPWLGTAGGALPFGYTGRAHLNWAAAIHGPGTLEVSAADALADYGVAAEIDTGAGAWKDNGLDANGVPTATGPTGWKHQIDMGLIKSDISTVLRLNLTSLGTINGNFGVTVFKGMDTTNSVAYSHHGSWNNTGKPENTSNPFYNTGVGSGMEYLTHDATVDAVNYLEFFAEAGQVYTIALGGNGVGRWNANVSGYELSIAAVPVPGAVWLFGSAMAGMIGFGGRRKAAAAA